MKSTSARRVRSLPTRPETPPAPPRPALVPPRADRVRELEEPYREKPSSRMLGRLFALARAEGLKLPPRGPVGRVLMDTARSLAVHFCGLEAPHVSPEDAEQLADAFAVSLLATLAAEEVL